MKKCKITGHRGIYNKEKNLIITFGRSIKFYDGKSFKLLFQTKGIRYISDICLNASETVLWVITTENWVYSIDIDSFIVTDKFRIKVDKKYQEFELDLVSASSDNRFLYFSGFCMGKDLLLAYNLLSNALLILEKNEEAALFKKYFAGNQITYVWSDVVSEETRFIEQYPDKTYLLSESSNLTFKRIRLNVQKKNHLDEAVFPFENEHFLLCNGRLKRKELSAVVKINAQQVLPGDLIPFSAERGLYDEKKKVLILFSNREVGAIKIKDEKVIYRELYKSSENESVSDCVILEDELLILLESGSLLIEIWKQKLEEARCIMS